MSDPFGLMSPRTVQDPYPVWSALRREAPAYFSEGWNAWLITRYEDAAAAFRDKRLSANRSGGYAAKLPEPVRQHLAPLLGNLSRWTLLLDPPEHTRLRGLISKAFVPRAIEAMRPRIATLVSELLEPLSSKPTFDVIADLAQPLPTIVIGDMLGMRREDWPKLKGWSDALAAFMGASQMSQDVVGAALRAVVEMEANIRDVVADHRAHPRDDLMMQLLRAEESGRGLDADELLATCTSLLFGGHETTTNLIGNGVLALAQNEAARARLANDRGQLASATEELLRYDSPVQRMGRVVVEPFELHGETLKAGDRVFMVLGAANRDASQFERADELDVGRADNRHLSFGLGIHFCVGAALGRLEAQLALDALLDALPTWRLADDAVEFHPNLTVRGLKRLRLETAPLG
jgi:cytochrome P450